MATLNNNFPHSVMNRLSHFTRNVWSPPPWEVYTPVGPGMCFWGAIIGPQLKIHYKQWRWALSSPLLCADRVTGPLL